MIAFASKSTARRPSVLTPQVLGALRPRPRVNSWEWITTQGRDTSGRLFDGDKVPHLRGVCEAWDHPGTRKVVLMFGTRLGKTFSSHMLMACAMANNPMPGMYATTDKELARRTLNEKVYPILENIRQTCWQLMPERLRSISEIRLAESTWAVAYSGAASLLDDWPAYYGIGNEVDKWTTKQSTEGDTLARFLERFKDSPSHKILLESSPSLKGHSRIEAEYLSSDQRRYYVPCPHCKHYQVLRMGSGQPGEPGLRWDKGEDGRNDPDIAERTARYICEKCKKAIHDRHRAKMMRRGVWVPRGCRVEKGRVCGKPLRSCSTAGFQLSSLYSLQLTWGKIAAAFIEKKKNPRNLQMFINGWLADTWEPHKPKSEPEQIAERLRTEDKVGVIPKWATWLFAAVDVQADFFKWFTLAVGPAGNGQLRFAVVDRGIVDTWDEVYNQCVNHPTPHEDGGPALMPALSFIDSGEGRRTDEVYRKCREWSRPDRLVLPSKGANTDMRGEPYERVTVGDGTKRGTRIQKRQALRNVGVLRIRVNSFFYEPIIQRMLEDARPGEADSLTLPAELADDEEFVRELCNGIQSDDPSKLDPNRLLWVKRWENEANDFRDCLKYARCAVDVKFRGNWRVAGRRQIGAKADIRVAVQQPAQEEPQGRRRILRRLPRRRERIGRR